MQKRKEGHEGSMRERRLRRKVEIKEEEETEKRKPGNK